MNHNHMVLYIIICSTICTPYVAYATSGQYNGEQAVHKAYEILQGRTNTATRDDMYCVSKNLPNTVEGNDLKQAINNRLQWQFWNSKHTRRGCFLAGNVMGFGSGLCGSGTFLTCLSFVIGGSALYVNSSGKSEVMPCLNEKAYRKPSQFYAHQSVYNRMLARKTCGNYFIVGAASGACLGFASKVIAIGGGLYYVLTRTG